MYIDLVFPVAARPEVHARARALWIPDTGYRRTGIFLCGGKGHNKLYGTITICIYILDLST